MKYGISLLAVLFLFSCKNSSETKSTSTTDYGPQIEKYYELYNQHNWTDLALLYSPMVEVYTPSQGTTPVQKTNVDLVPVFEDLQRAFPNIKESVVKVYPSTQSAIVEHMTTGISPVGDSLKLMICTIFEFDENGKIRKEHSYYGE